MDENGKVLWHQSGVNPKGEPFVQLLLEDQIIAQMTPDEARDHARAITEAAEASEQDAFLLDFARNKIGMPFQEAGKIIVAFREYRQERTGKSQGPRHPTDWVMPPKGKMPDYGPDNPTRKS
jgi:hypothetical protein